LCILWRKSLCGSAVKKYPSTEREDIMNKIKRIGLLTAGGDCPGLNAVIRAVDQGRGQRL